MKKVISLKLQIAFFLVVSCIQDSALAQQNNIDALQTKVLKLQQKVSQLESKVERLEQLILSEKDTGEAFQRNVNSDGWQNKQNWRRLKRGMSKEEVRQILGEPDRIAVNPLFGTWIYGIGKVTFSGGEVDGWSEPSNDEFQRIQSDTETGNEQEKSAPYELQWEGDVERNPMVQPVPTNTTGSEATVTIRFEVKPDGTVGRIIPIKQMNPKLEREVMQTLRKWRFSRLPGGVPQHIQWGTVTFRFVVE